MKRFSKVRYNQDEHYLKFNDKEEFYIKFHDDIVNMDIVNKVCEDFNLQVVGKIDS